MWTLALLLVLLLLLAVMAHPARAISDFYFHASSRRPTCFVDELAQDGTLILSYTHDEFATKPLKLVISTQDGVMEEFSITSAARGRFAYLAKDTEQHRVCVERIDVDDDEDDGPDDKPRWQADFYLKTEVLAEHDSVGNLLANRTHVVTLQQELASITSRVEVLLRDLQTARVKEAHFRDQGERVNSYVLWLSIGQTAFLLAAAAFQSVHLHSFFLHKKIA